MKVSLASRSAIEARKVWLVLPTLNRYQSARYKALADGRTDTGVLEIAGGGSYPIPGWRSPTADELPGVVTLFQGAKYGDIGHARVCARLKTELDARRVEIGALAVLGWEDPAALTGVRWASAYGIPLIVMSESNEFDASRQRLREWIKERVVRLCSAGLAGGSCAADYLASLGMARDRVFLGYDAVDNEYFARGAARAREQRSEVRRRHGLPRDYFLVSARFVAKKNLPRLLQAYARYRHLAGDAELWHLVLLGNGPLEADLRRLIACLGLQDSVLLPGARPYEELPAYYGLASALVHPSTVEQWGLVVNEAMASGLPVLVSSRCGCAPDLVQEGVNGYTFDPLNIEQLASLMSRVAAPGFQLTAFGSASKSIISRWSPEVFAGNLRKAVQVAVSMPRPNSRGIDRMLLWGLAYLRG